jgi:hypothetical protein
MDVRDSILDSGLLIDGVLTNGAAPVPLPAAAWAGMALMGGLGGTRALRARFRRDHQPAMA